MRVEQVAVPFVDAAYGLPYYLVGEAIAADLAANLLVAAIKEVKDTGKIARIAHIHSVGNGCHGGARRVDGGLEVVEEHVVAVVGCDEMFHRQSHPVGKKSGGDVPEVPAGNGNDKAVRLSHAVELGIGVEIVERLREETGNIDGVGRGELHVAVELLVHERRLHQCLAVVESAVDLQRGNVLPESGELTFLYRAYLPFGIEHVDVNALDTEKSVGNGAARVARGGNKHIHLP